MDEKFWSIASTVFYFMSYYWLGWEGEKREMVSWFSKCFCSNVFELYLFTPPFTHLSLRTRSVGDAKTSGVRVGDKLLEVNGVSVRGLEHREAGKMIAEGPPVATLLIHTIKPAPTPNGKSVQDFLLWIRKFMNLQSKLQAGRDPYMALFIVEGVKSPHCAWWEISSVCNVADCLILLR